MKKEKKAKIKSERFSRFLPVLSKRLIHAREKLMQKTIYFTLMEISNSITMKEKYWVRDVLDW